MRRSTSPTRPPREPGTTRRLAWTAIGAALVVGAAVVVPGVVGEPAGPTDAQGERARGGLQAAHEAASGRGTLPFTDAHGHEVRLDVDPATKNAVSRAGEEVGAETHDPTTATERAAAAAYVARERARRDPRLGSTKAYPRRTTHPRTRYAMARGCYTLVPAGEPTYFQATDLGEYLLLTPDEQLVAAGGGRADEPSDATVWTASKKGRLVSLANDGERLEVEGRTAFRLTTAKGCATWPEAQVDVSGRPHSGVTPFQEVRGYVDAHTHHMAYEFLGGEVHCGKPWDRFGVEVALTDCDDHNATGGYGALLETALSGEVGHDPVGWPTFVDWPAPASLTHEGTYYRWMERAWRGGQRLFTNLLVENNQLCQLYPLKRNSCDDMDSVRLQIQRTFEFQDYVDAQFGGPGRGFYRIVTSPFEARRVINEGKMAVILGIETSVPFGCTFKKLPGGDLAQCDAETIDEQMDEMHDLGVRQMELVNKFDNALSGIAGDAGETGVAVNNANFLETGTYWDMRTCSPAGTENHDRNQTLAAPEISADQQDALFGAIGQLFGSLNLPALPLYPRTNHCNDRGLTTLGEHTINSLAKRRIVFDPDHMSVKARNQALDQIEELGYQGLLSSHSWSTPDAYPRIYELGGFITPYAGDSTGFVEKWRKHVGWADERYYFAMGYGADINGLGAQGDPRGADVPNPVTYPFKGLGGVTVRQQRAGERVYDINADGVAQYGLYPDWIEDLGKVADAQQGDGSAVLDDMARGAEGYLQMWERAYGIAPDSCRNPEQQLPVATVQRRLERGMSTRQVMKVVGQPYTRLGRTFGFCATQGGAEVEMTATFTKRGSLRGVRRT